MVKHALILAGGAGTRLWPASTRKHPKQFLRLEQGRSLFAMTLQRALGLGIDGSICVVTHRDHTGEIMQECRQVLGGGRLPLAWIVVLAEPQSRNTAPAITYAVTLLQRIASPTDTLIVMPADHLIEPLSKFAADVDTAAKLAEQGRLVTFGIPPLRPETGYGYIEAGEKLGSGFEVRKFKEKPDEATARSFLAQGNHYWNSGMFAFRGDRYFEELRSHTPELARIFLTVPHAKIPRRESEAEEPVLVPVDDAVAAAYRTSPSISIDYAVMEHSSHCAVVPAGFSWSDVGSWDEVAALYAAGSGQDGADRPVIVDGTNNYVLSDLPVALAGVSDLIVVVKNGTVLICRKGKSQLVKKVVQVLKEEDRTDLL